MFKRRGHIHIIFETTLEIFLGGARTNLGGGATAPLCTVVANESQPLCRHHDRFNE